MVINVARLVRHMRFLRTAEIYLLIFLALRHTPAFSGCHNGCACWPSDSPNVCDVGGWCVNRESIVKEDLRTVTGTSDGDRLYVKFSVTYLNPECSPNTRPYSVAGVELYITAK